MQYQATARATAARRAHWLAHSAATALLIAAVATPQIAYAQPAAINFQIDAQPLDQALMDFSQQSNIDVIAPANLTTGRRAGAVRGTMSAEQALTQLLAGTGLAITATGPRTYTLASGSPDGKAGEYEAGQGPAWRASAELDPEEIVVTGSNIRGGEKPIGGQLITVSQEDIQRSGFSSVRDISETLPQNFGSGATGEFQINSDSGSNYANGSTFNLRGLGQTATLSLINGRRVPTGGTAVSVSDISTVPLVAIERVEILPDGASAVYGSDAVAGVVNIVLRRDFEGHETAARYGFTTQRDNLDEFKFSHVGGTAWETGNAVLSYEFHHRDQLLKRDRPFSASRDLRPLGGEDNRLPYGSPGNILTPTGGLTVLYALPPGQDGQNLTRADLLPPSAANYYNYWADTSLFPRRRQHSLFGHLAQNLSEKFEFYIEGRYTHRKIQDPRSSPLLVVTIPRENPYWFDAYGTGESVRVAYSPDDVYKPEVATKVNSYSAVAGINVHLPGKWMARPYISYSEDKVRAKYGTYSIQGVEAASNSTSRVTALNPFGDGSVNGPDVLALIKNQVRDDTDARIFQANVVTDGPLFKLFGNLLRGAVGLDYRHEKFLNDSADDAAPIRTISFKREVIAAFGELRAPIIRKDHGIPGVKTFDLSLSLRHDKYKDSALRPTPKKRTSQSTTNPRVGARWSPIEGVQLNGSYGTSFRAPRLDILATIPSVSAVSYTDAQSPTGRSYTLVMGGVDPDISAETADTWSLGAEFAPLFAPQAKLQVNYFNIKFKNQVAAPAHPQIMLNDAGFADLVVRNPSLDQILATCNTVPPQHHPSDRLVCTTGAGIAAIIDNRTANLSRTEIDGLDVQASYLFESQLIGQLIFSLNSTVLFNFEQSVTRRSPAIERKSTPTYPVNFRARGNINWSPQETMNFSAFVNYVNDYYDPLSRKTMDAWTTTDFTATYNTGDTAKNSWLKNISLQFSIQNLFDQDPPFYGVSASAGYDYANADPLGRLISFTIKKSW